MPLLSVVAVLVWSLASPPLDLPALAGASPAAVAQVLGTPLDNAGADEGPLVSQTFDVPGGRLSVAYCGGDVAATPQAVSFELRLHQPLPTAAALLTMTGLRPDQIVVTEQGEGHVEISPRPEIAATSGPMLVRALVSRTQDGWSTVVVDFAVLC